MDQWRADVERAHRDADTRGAAIIRLHIDLAAKRYRELLKELKTMSDERFSSVWGAIEDTPAAAENMKLRSALMIAVKEHVKRQGWTQRHAARDSGFVSSVGNPHAAPLRFSTTREEAGFRAPKIKKNGIGCNRPDGESPRPASRSEVRVEN